MPAGLLAVAFVLGLFLVVPRGKADSPSAVWHRYRGAFTRAGTEWGVSPELLAAIAWVESRGDARAINSADPSYGLMQIYCAGDGTRCENALKVDGWPPRRTSLLDPGVSIQYAAQILADDFARIPTMAGALAAYNGGEHKGSSYTDQQYIDDVLRAYAAIQGGEG